MIDKDVTLTLLYVVYDDQARRAERPPSSLALLLFGIF